MSLDICEKGLVGASKESGLGGGGPAVAAKAALVETRCSQSERSERESEPTFCLANPHRERPDRENGFVALSNVASDAVLITLRMDPVTLLGGGLGLLMKDGLEAE